MSTTIKGKETQRAEISKSRSKKKPFKVRIYAENGEPTMSPQLLTTWLNCKNNLLSVMRAFHGTHINVTDKSKKQERIFKLNESGLEENIS
ncbi:MAG: hypothetical protein KBA90_13245 [Chitinophagaceae bacterium]|nr:hypothetical protein [Chitinophagaceae bacterium]MBP7109516.1 hypothetical protein [Chitinophagaceae bacterium]